MLKVIHSGHQINQVPPERRNAQVFQGHKALVDIKKELFT